MIQGVKVQVLERKEGIDFNLLALVKAKLMLDSNLKDYDELINTEIGNAIERIEAFTGLAIGEQTRRVSYSVLDEPDNLPYGPYLSTVSVATGGIVDSFGLVTANWSTGGTVIYTCGYSPDTLPKGLLSAVMTAAAEFTGLKPDMVKNGWKSIAAPFSTRTWAD